MEYVRNLRVFRSADRAQNLDKMKELIDEALKNSKSKNRPVGEKMRWMALAGRLIVFKDHILKNQENELGSLQLMELKEMVRSLTQKESREETRTAGT